jgi:hypothetical protein
VQEGSSRRLYSSGVFARFAVACAFFEWTDYFPGWESHRKLEFIINEKLT